jgi:ATP/maltotriose-dependent transcriptional regulator MalT/DNA-binding SARP family transcriptional activator
MQLKPVQVNAKIQLPPRSSKVLSRSRLLNFLNEAAGVKLLIVSATAGYGKTSLLVDYAHQSDIPVCWYTLDRFDRDAGTFFAHLIAALRQRFPGFGQQCEMVLEALQNPARDWSSLAATMVNELYETIPEYFTVILDDFHHVEDVVPINDFLAYLLQYSEEHVHLIISSRRLPHLPNQALLFGRGQMEGLGAEALRFTAEEIQALARQNYDVDLPRAKAAELADHFEGWITGILLKAQSGWTTLLERAARSESVGSMYGYLVEQVFAEQTSELQAFLMESATFNEMSADALDALRGADDSGRWLAQVDERNLFLVSLDDQGRWYRYHRLFRQFLQERLKRIARGRFEALHRRAAQILEAQREWPAAFEHYVQAADGEALVRLIETAAEELYTTGHWETLRRWIGAVESEPAARDENPVVAYYRGLMLMEQGDPAAALSYAEGAWRGFSRRRDEPLAVQALLLQATALRMQGSYLDAMEIGEGALKKALELGVDRILAAAQRTVGMAYYYMGMADRAVEHLEEALRLYRLVGHIFYTASLHHELGIAYRATGQWRRAVVHYRQANRLWERLNNFSVWAATLNSVGVVHHLRGEFVEAYGALTQALERARTAGYRRMEAVILSSLGDLYRDTGRYEEAQEAFRRSAELADEVGEGAISVYARQGLGETFLTREDYGQAEAWLGTALEWAKQHDSLYEIGLCEMVRGIMWVNLDHRARAWISLGQAKEFFERGGHLHELARVHYHLARLSLRQGRHEDTARNLGMVLDLSQQLGYDTFLVSDGRRTSSLLKYAASLNGHREWWLDILERASREPGPLTAEAAEEQDASPGPQLRVFALGRDRVQVGQKETKTGRPKVRELFFYLMAHRARGVSKEQIMAQFWPEAEPAKAALSFKSAIYRLRRLYSDVDLVGGRYRPALPEGAWYDVEAFEAALDQAEAAQATPECIPAYERALELYAGDYLETFDAPWCDAERERLRERFRRGLHALAEIRLARGDYADSQRLYRRALAANEFDEAACQGMLRSYAEAGRRPQALAFYHEFAQRLYEEMGIAPSPETEALYQEILRREEGVNAQT